MYGTSTAGTDNLGREIKSQPVGMLATASAFEVEESGVSPAMFDLGISIGSRGVSDESAESEIAILAASLLHRPNTWLRYGLQIGWNPAESGRMDFSTPVYFTLFPDPMSDLVWFFTLNPFTYTVRSEALEGTTSAFSFDPGASFGVEFPMGNYGLAANVGANYAFNSEGVDVNQVNVGAGVTLFFRLGR